MAEVILIRGLPGSGKSTFARMLVGKINSSDTLDWRAVHIETDMYFVNGKGEYQFVPEEIPIAHRWAQDWADETLGAGRSVVVSNTFSRVWEMQPYIDLAKKYDVKLTVMTMEGDYGNVHNVPDFVVEKMRKRWEPYPRRFLAGILPLFTKERRRMKHGWLFRPGSFWVGVHWSKNNRRFCINLIPCITLWIVLEGGNVP